MKFASHNSMTYLPARQWWLKPFAWIARCQSKSIKEQLKAGVRYFDLRIRFDKNGLPVFAHGLAEYDASLLTVCREIHFFSITSTNVEKSYIRITLENKSRKDEEYQRKCFKKACQDLERLFQADDLTPIIAFCGGQTKADWSTVYEFGTEQPLCKECYSSMPAQRNPLWKVWPWLFAKFHNRKAVERHKAEGSEEILMLDYV